MLQMQHSSTIETMISCRQARRAGVERTGIAFRPIGGGDKVLRVEMSGFAPEPASLPLVGNRQGKRMTTAVDTRIPADGAAAAGPRAPKVGPRRRLFAKYAFALVGLVSLILLVNGLLNVWFSYREARDAAIRLQREKADAAAQRIDEFIGEIEKQIGWTTATQWASSPIDQRRFDYGRLQRQVPAITELIQLDGQGHEQLKVSRLAMDVVGSGADYSADPRFTEALAKKAWFGPVYFRKESEPYMTMAVAQSGRNAGVTVAEVNLKLIWDVITAIKIGKSGYAYVVDGDGRLIAHPDISRVLRNTDLSALPQVAAARGGSVATAEPAAIVRNLDGHRVLSASAPIPKLGWLVFVEQPISEALAPLYTTLLNTGLLLVLGLAVAILAGLLLARRMTGPIRELDAGAARIGAGALDHRIRSIPATSSKSWPSGSTRWPRTCRAPTPTSKRRSRTAPPSSRRRSISRPRPPRCWGSSTARPATSCRCSTRCSTRRRGCAMPPSVI